MTNNPYDQVPYPGLSYTPTHPDRLAVIARLMGLNPAPADHCRVLELGCAVGGNLVPMAYSLPHNRFLGIDNSARQVAEAQKAAEALGLENVAFRHLDILDITPELGQFDYIIAHGIYSWVPTAVQHKILDIFCENLAPNGVAYVSYNTYPGWHMVRIVRDMLLYHTRHIADPVARADQGRSILDFFAQATTSDKDSAYSSFLRTYAGIIGEKLDGSSHRHSTLVLHDEMAEINEPCYFYQFAEQVAQHGLQYLGEADLSSMKGRLVEGSEIPPQVAEGLQHLASDVVELEQAVDFMHNRMFRRTLLCHQEIELPPRISLEAVQDFWVTSRARPALPDPDLYSVSVVKFQSGEGIAISTDHPVSKVALDYLAEQWPAPVHFFDLLETACARVASRTATDSDTPSEIGDRSSDAEVMAANLLTAFGYDSSLVDFHSYLPAFSPNVSERPVASTVARYQTQQAGHVTNLRHERVTLDNLDRFLLYHLDGSHDPAALLDRLMDGPVAQGVLTVQSEGEEPVTEDQVRAILAAEIERRLDWLACAALLVA